VNVRLKTKALKNNRLSYFLQHYDPGTGKRHKEYLGLYLIDKPRNEFDRNHNRETKDLTQKVHSKKLLEFQEGRFGFRSKEKLQITFLAYFESIAEKKKKSSSQSNYKNWTYTLREAYNDGLIPDNPGKRVKDIKNVETQITTEDLLENIFSKFCIGK